MTLLLKKHYNKPRRNLLDKHLYLFKHGTWKHIQRVLTFIQSVVAGTFAKWSRDIKVLVASPCFARVDTKLKIIIDFNTLRGAHLAFNISNAHAIFLNDVVLYFKIAYHYESTTSLFYNHGFALLS